MKQTLFVRVSPVRSAAIGLFIFLIPLFCWPSHGEKGRKQLEWHYPELAPHVSIERYWDAGGRDILRVWQVKPRPGMSLHDLLRGYGSRVEAEMASERPSWWPDEKARAAMPVFYRKQDAHWRTIWHRVADDTYYLQWLDT